MGAFRTVTFGLLGMATMAAAAPAAAQSVRSFDLPAQPLQSALRAVARIGGVQIAIDENAVAGRNAPALRGRYTPEAAMRRLLQGSGLNVRQGASGIYIVAGRPHAPALEADPPPAPDVVEAPEIIVTARKREERAIDVPIAVSVERGRRLEQRGVKQLSDFLQETPGVGIYDLGGGTAKLTIRGVASSLGANENGYYLDDLPFTGVTVPIVPDARVWDLDRIEVLRGPQGTLFGEGSMGGTVRILSQGADLNAWEGKGAAYLSSTADGGTNRGIKAALNAPILPGRLAVRLSGTAEHMSGWIDNRAAGRTNINDQTYTTFRAKARFDPTDRLSLTGSYWHYKGRFPAGGGGETDDGEQSLFAAFDVKQIYSLYGVTARYDLGGAEIFYGFSHNHFVLPQSGDLLGGPFVGDIDIKVDAHELRLASTAEGPLQWTVGAYARNARRRDTVQVQGFAIDNVDNTFSSARALFGEATYTLPFAPIDLTAGLRYYRERLTGFEVNSDVVAPDEGATYASWNPRFSIAWRPRRNVTIYASAAKGFRAGQLQPSVSIALGRIYGVDLPAAVDQDSLWTYELGAKADLLGRRLSVEAAVYHSDWRGVTVRIPIANTGFNGLINSKGTRTRGAELSVSWQPMAGLNLKAGGSYIDAVYAQSVPGTGIVVDAPVEDIARFTASASADYRRSLGKDMEGFARIGWIHSSPRSQVSFPDYLPGDRIDRVDLRMGVDWRGWSVAGFVDNLTNERGAASYRTVQPMPGDVVDISAFRLRPRTIGIDAAYRF